MNEIIDVTILTKDRVQELTLLLQSLRTQTYQKFDVNILDDGSQIPIVNNYAVNVLLFKLRDEGHRINVIRNNMSKGIGICRQQIDEHSIENGRGDYLCRIDDDCILDDKYLEKLMQVINTGYDLASGVTPPMMGHLLERDINFVKPIINRVVIDENGFVVNSDDCGYKYLQEEILPTHHFRSCALYKKEICKKVKYEDNLANSGFREEEFYSFRTILEGFKLGVHTGAIAWHLQCPGGGDRKPDYVNHSLINQKLLNRFVKKIYKQQGNFIDKYNEMLGLKLETPIIDKNTNLIYSKEE